MVLESNKKLSKLSYEINLCQSLNIRIEEIAGNAKYRKNEQFQNLTMFENLRHFINYQIFIIKIFFNL